MLLRGLRRLLLLPAILSLILAGCGAPGGTSDQQTGLQEAASPAAGTTTSADATPATSDPAVPQELIVGAPSDSYRIDPPERATVGMYPTNAGIYETLVRVTPEYQVEPLLASAWEFVEPNTWRFTLREGITFHDGQPFNAEAIVYTMERVARAGGMTGIAADSVKVIDDYTVEITPGRPNLRLIQQLTHPNYSILAPGSDPTSKPVGTGPFTFVEYVRDDHISVVRNESYWGEKPMLEKITFRFIPDDNTRVLALKAGEVDLVVDAPRELTADISATEGLKLTTSTVGAYEAIYVNAHGEPPYDIGSDPLVRQALALAINKESIVRDVWRGNAEVNNTMVPVHMLGEFADRLQGSSYDPEQARQLLEQAGWVDSDGDGIREKDGRKLSLVMIVGFPTPEIHRPMPEVVQAQLAEVGIEMTIDTTPDTASYEARLASGEGDLWAEIGNQNDANPCFLPDLLFYSKVPEGGESGDYARLFAPGEKFDTFIEDCRAAVMPEEVAESAAGAMSVIIDEEHIVIPIAGIFRIYAMKNSVQGFQPHPSRTNQTWEGVSISADQ